MSGKGIRATAGVLVALALTGLASPASAGEVAGPGARNEFTVAGGTSCDTHGAFRVCVSRVGDQFFGTAFNRGESAPARARLVITNQRTWTKSAYGRIAPGDTLTVKITKPNGRACAGLYYPENVAWAPWMACIN